MRCIFMTAVTPGDEEKQLVVHTTHTQSGGSAMDMVIATTRSPGVRTPYRERQTEKLGVYSIGGREGLIP